jgi:hypothetical protein
MRYRVIEFFKVKTLQREIELRRGQIITLARDKAIRLLNLGKITPAEESDVVSWLDILSDSEREIFRGRMGNFDGALPKELAEVKVIKRIIHERLILGKCDKCERVNGCILTRGQRQLCEVVKIP